MTAHKLNPLPATPLSGRGMLGERMGWAVAALRKALFSAERITEIYIKGPWMSSTYLEVVLTWRHIVYVILHLFATREKTSSLKKKTYSSGKVPHFHLFKFNIRFTTAQQGQKILTHTSILPDALLFHIFSFRNQYCDRLLGWRTNLETSPCRLSLRVMRLWRRWLNHEGMLVKINKQYSS